MTKKPYEPPKLRRIDLVVEEAVLSACKTQQLQPARGNRWCTHAQCKKQLGS